MNAVNERIFTCKYFDLYQLSRGVYGAIATNTGGAVCNAGIIDLGDKTVVFDAFLSMEAAKELIGAAVRLTGKKPAIVVNSHYHMDHTLGNAAFDADVLIVSSLETMRLCEKSNSETMSMYRKNGRDMAAEFKGRLAGTSGEQERALLERQIVLAELLSSPGFKLRKPDAGYIGGLEISGSLGTAVVTVTASGHTPSESILSLADEGIVFTGDLLFVNAHPWLGAGEPQKWASTIDELLSLEAEVFVPGHGDIGTKGDLVLIKEYIGIMEGMAAKINDGLLSMEEVSEKLLPEPFNGWLGDKLRPNLAFYCDFLKKAGH